MNWLWNLFKVKPKKTYNVSRQQYVNCSECGKRRLKSKCIRDGGTWYCGC